MRSVLLFLVLLMPLPCKAAEDVEVAAVKRVLDDWHDAAARADGPRYFSHFAEDGVFMGTDATERWTVPAFRAWSKRFFDRGKAWSFVSTSRNVTIQPPIAWFDEALSTPNMGPCRGSGVLRKTKDGWKIAQYNLSVPIPNELVDRFVKEIRDAAKPAAPTPPDGQPK